jgi:predicted RND superfamily exporter protein
MVEFIVSYLIYFVVLLTLALLSGWILGLIIYLITREEDKAYIDGNAYVILGIASLISLVLIWDSSKMRNWRYKIDSNYEAYQAKKQIEKEKEKRQAKQEEKQRQSQANILTFIKELNPTLIEKMDQMDEEVNEAQMRILKLKNLSTKHVSYQEMINDRITKWRTLIKKLEATHQKIYSQMERAYVIDQISQANNQERLERLSLKLLKLAHITLVQTNQTQKVLEHAIEKKD